jgi:hypothetical protein
MERVPVAQSGLNLSIFQEQATALFQNILSQFPSHDLILTFPDHLHYYVSRLLSAPVIQSLFRTVCPFSVLSSGTDVRRTAVFITATDRPSIDQLLRCFSRVPTFPKVVLAIPRATATLDHIVRGDSVIIFDFPGELLPVECDFFLMPFRDSFRRYFIDADFDGLYCAALALAKIERYFGRIPQVFTVGEAAHSVADLLAQYDATECAFPQLDMLIIFDRSVDLVTPVTSQVNIEGILSTVFGKHFGAVQQRGHNPLILTESDEAFRATRMLSWQRFRAFARDVGTVLDDAATALKTRTAQELLEGKEKTFRMIQFGRNLTQLVQAANDAVEQRKAKWPSYDSIVECEFGLLDKPKSVEQFVENQIVIFNDWRTGLRLLALQGACGVPASSCRGIQAEVVAEFGTAAQEALLDLERVGYLAEDRGVAFPVKKCLDKLVLIAERDKDAEPTEAIGTCFGGFVPPSLRIVKGIVDCLATLKKVAQKIGIKEKGEPMKREKGEVRKVLVFFLGGVTATEVGTLRNVGRETYNGEVEFIVGSTEQVTGDSFIEQFCPFLRKRRRDPVVR